MKNSLARLSLIIIGWLGMFAVALPDVWRDVWAQESAATPEQIESARARWNALTPQQKAQLKRRFEHLQKLDSHERTQLQKRGQRYRQMEKRALSRLSKQERERFNRLSEEQRQSVLADLVDDERKDKGRQIESKLPRSMREWMKNASPKERQAKLEAFKAETRGRISARAVEDFAKALGYGEPEIRRLERLPMGERMATVMRLRKKLTAKQLAEYGLPRGITQEHWDELEALPPEEYVREVWRLQNRGILAGAIEPGKLPGSEPLHLGRELNRKVRHAMRLEPSELLELSDLPRAERRRRIANRRRVQAMSALRENEAFSAQRLDELDSLEDEALLEEIRSMLHECVRPDGSRNEGKQ